MDAEQVLFHLEDSGDGVDSVHFGLLDYLQYFDSMVVGRVRWVQCMYESFLV